VAALLAGAGWIGIAANSSVWFVQRCVTYAHGTGPHPGSGCSQVSAGYSWDTNLWLGLIGGLALMAIAVALWIRLPRASRVAPAMTVVTLAVVSDAFSGLLSAL
jgi:hypothetical protein